VRWEDERRSDNVEDRRGLPIPGGIAGGGLGLVVVVVLALLFGVDPRMLLQSLPSQSSALAPASQPAHPGTADPMKEFVAAVLGSTEDTWGEVFRRSGMTYEAPKLVLFSGAVRSACGFAQAAVGPFYCPADRKVYIDLNFYRELKDRFQAPGEFAQAYVIAHEIGHHVQNLLGLSDKVHAAQQRGSEAHANALSVRMELPTPTVRGISWSAATWKQG